MVKVWRRTETGEAPRQQGATTENIGQYLREEQRSQRGCIAGRMQPDFYHGLLGGWGRHRTDAGQVPSGIGTGDSFAGSIATCLMR